MLQLDDLTLHQVAMEIRYPETYRAFDHCGELATQVLTTCPEWELAGANPTQLDFARSTRGLSASVGTINTSVKQVQGADYYDLHKGDDLKADYMHFVGKAMNIYRIDYLNRIGYRKIYNWKLRSAEEALQEWSNLPFMPPLKNQEQPGDMIIRLKISEDISLRFGISNIEYDVTVGHTTLNLTTKTIYRLPPELRKKSIEALAEAEKKMRFLPDFGLRVDLDWIRKDIAKSTPEDIEDFVEVCEKLEASTLSSLFKGQTK